METTTPTPGYDTDISQVPNCEEGLHWIWHDQELKQRYLDNLAELRRKMEQMPDLYNEEDFPFKILTPQNTKGIKSMRLQWLLDNHPHETEEMMMANVLEQHLKDTQTRFIKRRTEIRDRLLEQRHLLRRSDIMQAHPEITEMDRYSGMKQVDMDADWMAIAEVIESL